MTNAKVKKMIHPFLDHMRKMAEHEHELMILTMDLLKDECKPEDAYRQLVDLKRDMINNIIGDMARMFEVLARLDGGKDSYTQYELEKWQTRMAQRYTEAQRKAQRESK